MTESGRLMNGSEIVLECLAREGVDCFFGYPGGVTLPFYDALVDSHIKHVLVRHEENACFAAEGYAKSTGKVGVCCATSGPGATNLVTGLVDAMMDSIPIVAITGQVHSKLIGSDAFQEADTFGITRPATKHNFMVKTLAELPQIVHEAFYIAASMAMTECDLLIALGTRFDDRVTGSLHTFARHARVIHVDIDPAEVGKNRNPDIPIVGDVRRVLQKLNKVIQELAPEFGGKKAEARKKWWGTVRGWMAERPYDRPHAENEIKPQHLMDEIDRLSGGQAIVTSDVGQHQMWAAQLIKFNEPRLWINSGGLGAMGFGLPAAIGAQFARPDKLVFALVGDGGFQMSIPELATIANHALPVKIIVMNNGYLGMVRQ